MNLVDTHCHLQFNKLVSRIDEVIASAEADSVTRVICVGTTLDDSAEAADIAAKYSNVWAAAGNHPHDGKDFDFKLGPGRLASLLDGPKIVAVGEIGLDYYRDYTSKKIQEKMLRVQIEAGLPSNLPFIFHVRDAFDDFWRIYDSYPKMRGVLHSFSATKKELDEILSRGLYVAFNGIMTFTRDADQLAAAKTAPLDRLLLETDAPFLAPAPYRGKLCEPKHVRTIAEFLADLRNESIEKVAEQTTANAVKLFGLK